MAPTPVPTPNPTSSPNASTAWNQTWNQAWNQGFNNPYGPIGPQANTPGYSQGYFAGQQAFAQRQPSNQGVLGASTYNPPAGSGSPMPSAPANNNLTQSLANSADQVSQAQIQSAIAQYNQMQANLEAQRSPLQNAYDTGIQNLNGSIQQAQGQADSQTQLLQNQSQNAINTANQNYLQLQGQNRGLARAYGGFSSDFEQNQNMAGRNFGNTVAGIQNDTTSRVNDVQSNLQGYLQQASAMKSQLGSQLEQGMRQIAMNEYATDQQKASAIGQIQADYSTKLANINQAILSFQQQYALAQQQAASYAALLGKSASGFNPTAQAQSLLNMTPASINAAQNPQQLTGSNVDVNKLLFPQAQG